MKTYTVRNAEGKFTKSVGSIISIPFHYLNRATHASAKWIVNTKHVSTVSLMLLASLVPQVMNYAEIQYKSFTTPTVYVQGIPQAHAAEPTDLEKATEEIKKSPEFQNTVEALAQSNAALVLRDREQQIVKDHAVIANQYNDLAEKKAVQSALGWDDSQVAQLQAVEKAQGRGVKK